jgi:hypothetical protein
MRYNLKFIYYSTLGNVKKITSQYAGIFSLRCLIPKK